jgi:transcriptional regulator with GAF, ATPase, and Fis domain
MSQVHATLIRTKEGWLLSDCGSKNGVVVNGERAERGVLADGDIFELGHTFFRFGVADFRPGEDAEWVTELEGPIGFRTLQPALAREFAKLGKLAPSDVPVLVLGETGTGKELVARAVHAASLRKGSLVPVNCGALPPNLVESELFGAKRGAFSGATEERVGLVRAADKGTLFLDEIGDLPAIAQASLLRVLQEREVLAVGATKAVPVDARFLAATHHDLASMVESKRFRADLLARLTGFTMRLPPLRERMEDFGVMVASLLERVPGGEAVTFHPAAVRLLLRYSWPLNVRELEKCMHSACVLASGAPLDLEHLPAHIRGHSRPPPAAASAPRRSGPSLPSDSKARAAPLTPERDAIREELVRKLVQHQGNVSAVARDMGKARMQIHRWLRQFDLDAESFRAPSERALGEGSDGPDGDVSPDEGPASEPPP